MSNALTNSPRKLVVAPTADAGVWIRSQVRDNNEGLGVRVKRVATDTFLPHGRCTGIWIGAFKWRMTREAMGDARTRYLPRATRAGVLSKCRSANGRALGPRSARGPSLKSVQPR